MAYRTDIDKLKKCALTSNEVSECIKAGILPKDYDSFFEGKIFEEFPIIAENRGLVYYCDLGAYDDSMYKGQKGIDNLQMFVYPSLIVFMEYNVELYGEKIKISTGYKTIRRAYKTSTPPLVVPLCYLSTNISERSGYVPPDSYVKSGSPVKGAIAGAIIGGATGAVIGATIANTPRVVQYGGGEYKAETITFFIKGCLSFRVNGLKGSGIGSIKKYGSLEVLHYYMDKSFKYDGRKTTREKLFKYYDTSEINWFSDDYGIIEKLFKISSRDKNDDNEKVRNSIKNIYEKSLLIKEKIENAERRFRITEGALNEFGFLKKIIFKKKYNNLVEKLKVCEQELNNMEELPRVEWLNQYL